MRATRTYLEITDPSQLNVPDWQIVPRPVLVRDPTPAFYRWLYAEVGRDYHWVDRLQWSDEEIREHLGSGDIRLFVLYIDGRPAGYFELHDERDGNIEIAYFGLLPGFLGRGLGRGLLVAAVREAFASGAARVWLHTCTLDHPAALANYIARGFRPFRTEEYEA